MKLCLRVVSCVVLIAASVASYAQLEEQLYRAELHDGMLQIPTEPHDLPIVLDWAVLVPKKYFSLEPGRIPRHLVKEFESRRNQYGYAEFFFKAPLTEALKKKHYYLVSENGVDEIGIENIGIKVQYALKAKSPHIEYTNYSGYLIADSKWNSPGYVLISDDALKLKVNDMGFLLEDIREDDPQFPKLVDHKGVKLKKGFSVGHKRRDSVFAFVSIEKPGYPKCDFVGLQIDYDQGMPMIANWNYARCSD